MRFDINRELNTMFVDDMWVAELDVSSLPADVIRVKWNGTDGWIKHVNSTLESRITDPSPYQPQLNAWTTARLSVTPPPTLAEAKTIKITLINQIFDLKRQASYLYVVAAGSYLWDATDGAMTNLALATVPKLISALLDVSAENSLIAQLNSNYVTLASQLNANYNTWGNDINGQVVDRTNTYIGGQCTQLVIELNNSVVGQANNALNAIDSQVNGQVNSNVVSPGNSLITHYNDQTLGVVGSGTNSVNNNLQGPAPVLGLTGALGHTSVTFSSIAIASAYRLASLVTSFNGPLHITHPLSVTTLSVSAPTEPVFTVAWIPIGLATMVTLSLLEVAGIMTGVSNRRNSLETARVNKVAQVNALTTIAAVIAYDATAGWPT